MSDENLRDDSIKLVKYSIVCTERGKERVLRCNECKVFSDNMDACDFDSWIVADYVAGLQRAGKAVPCNDKDLRVSYQVLGRWPKQDLQCEEIQLRRLAGIEQAIRELRAAPRSDIEAEEIEAKAEEIEAEEIESEEELEAAELDEEASQLLAALAALGAEAAMGKLVREMGLSRSTLSRRLSQLIEAGRVQRVGTGLKTRYRLVET